MGSAAFIITLAAAGLGAFACFRVPAVGPTARRTWAVLFMILLAAAAVCAVTAAKSADAIASTPLSIAGLAAGTAAAAFTGSPVTAAVLQWSQRAERRYRSQESSSEESESSDPERDSGLHGGLWIGFLERAGIAATLLAGWPTGLTVLAAIKALGRFSELKSADDVERFILGTFASFLWAAAWAGVTLMSVRGV